jgi:outer membrane protein OmpA-like peptidoglycan-associated protein
MTSSRTFERWTTVAALFILSGQILLPSWPARAAVGPEALLQPTPLVLKDGRIANVSIHVLPFDTGNDQLAGDVASRLTELTATVATDCFLTAQVIGHVSSREVADNETLAAHRLARARADAVQASLIGGGLPAKAIASVWDWQFLVREPRATLWLFRLVQGEDCEGLPLEGDASQLVAGSDAGQAASPQAATPSAETPAVREAARAPQPVAPPQPAGPAPRAAVDQAASGQPAAGQAAREPAASGPDLAGMVGSAVAAEAAPRADTSELAAVAPRSGDDAAQGPAQVEGRDARQAQETAAPRRAASPPPAAAAQGAGQAAPTAAATGPAPDAVPTLIRPLPALSPSRPDASPPASGRDRSSERTVATVEPARNGSGDAAQRPAAAATQQSAAQQSAAQQSAAQQNPEREGKVEWGQDNVVITFATNSSYFPPGTSRRLSSLLGNMADGGRYRVRLEVGVSGSDTVVGATSPEEAKRYNTWLAERRLSRVREWLDENAKDRQLEVEPAFQADDSSRRVVVRVARIS